MKVIRAKKAGFCMGVSLALQKLENALQTNTSRNNEPERICTLGPIIHNPQVLGEFARRGVHCLNNVGEANVGDYALIRAHGIPRDEEKLLRQRCKHVEDATCPRVKRAQTAIADATAQGAALLLFGEQTHPEVRGLVSYASGQAMVFGSVDELQNLPLDPLKDYVLASQTTQDRKMFNEIAHKLAAKLPKLAILSTICDATRERQEEAKEIAGMVDVMVIVGGHESGNTRRLAALAAQSGIPAFHVETIDALEKKYFPKNFTAGLTAGASTPKRLIDEVEIWLKNI